MPTFWLEIVPLLAILPPKLVTSALTRMPSAPPAIRPEFTMPPLKLLIAWTTTTPGERKVLLPTMDSTPALLMPPLKFTASVTKIASPVPVATILPPLLLLMPPAKLTTWVT